MSALLGQRGTESKAHAATNTQLPTLGPMAQRTHMQGPCAAEVDVEADLVAEVHEVLEQLGLGRGMAAEEGLLGEGAVDLMGHGHVRQQHELFHQPAAREKQPQALVTQEMLLGSQASPQ